MGNKNYNNYYNNNKHEMAQHSHNIPPVVENTPVEEVKQVETEIEKVEDTIVESTDPSTVETTPISGINETLVEDETTGEVTVEPVENAEEQIQNENVLEETPTSTQSNVVNVRVNANALNIRKEPKKDADIVTIVYKDELLVLVESTSIDGFYKVRTYTGIDGYCMEQFVDLV